MKLAWILLLCLMLYGWSANGTVQISYSTSNGRGTNYYTIRCHASCSIGGLITVTHGKKRSIPLSPCDTVYHQKFKDYDEDKDSKITLEELAETTTCTKGQMSTEFDEADKNALDNLKEVGEWISDCVNYHNMLGKKSMKFEVTEVNVSTKETLKEKEEI